MTAALAHTMLLHHRQDHVTQVEILVWVTSDEWITFSFFSITYLKSPFTHLSILGVQFPSMHYPAWGGFFLGIQNRTQP